MTARRGAEVLLKFIFEKPTSVIRLALKLLESHEAELAALFVSGHANARSEKVRVACRGLGEARQLVRQRAGGGPSGVVEAGPQELSQPMDMCMKRTHASEEA